LSYSSDYTLILWSSDGEVLKLLEGHSDSIYGIEILDEGRILSYSWDKTLRLWSREGELLNVLEGHEKKILEVEILKGEEILSYSSDKTLRLWNNEGFLIQIFYISVKKVDEFIIKEDKKIIINKNRFYIYENFSKIDYEKIDKKYFIEEKSNESLSIKIKLARLSNNINQLEQLSADVNINIKLAVFKNPNASKEIKEKLFKDKKVINSLSISYDTQVSLLEKIADKYYEDYYENLLLNPTVLEKTKEQLKRYKIASELNSEAVSKNEDKEYDEKIKLYLKSLDKLKELYNENQNRWAGFYTLVLNNLASSYYFNLEDYEKAYEIYKIIEKIKIDNKQIDDLELFNNIGSLCLKLMQFDDADIYFSKYFKIFDVKTIEEVENINEFIYPFVKWYQIINHLNEKEKIVELELMSKETMEILKNKFQNEFLEQMEIIHNGYLSLKDSIDSFDNEKYEIFSTKFYM
jgi:hypothetical protein